MGSQSLGQAVGLNVISRLLSPPYTFQCRQLTVSRADPIPRRPASHATSIYVLIKNQSLLHSRSIAFVETIWVQLPHFQVLYRYFFFSSMYRYLLHTCNISDIYSLSVCSNNNSTMFIFDCPNITISGISTRSVF